jgi:hypothetical protein
MIETTESIVDVTDQFKCLKAEQRDADVLILRKLDAPIQRMDGESPEEIALPSSEWTANRPSTNWNDAARSEWTIRGHLVTS